MPVALKLSTLEPTTENEGVRCGMPWCRAVLGDLFCVGRVKYVSLLEGFRREETGDYKLHRHAQWRVRHGKAPKDARPRWHGLHLDGKFGPGTGSFSMAGGPQREQLPTRERVRLDLVQVSCPSCGYSNTLDGNPR